MSKTVELGYKNEEQRERRFEGKEEVIGLRGSVSVGSRVFGFCCLIKLIKY